MQKTGCKDRKAGGPKDGSRITDEGSRDRICRTSAKDKEDEAKNEGDEAKDAGSEAKDEGDEAKDEGDEAKDEGDEAKDERDEAKDAGSVAKAAESEAQDMKLRVTVSRETTIRQTTENNQLTR